MPDAQQEVVVRSLEVLDESPLQTTIGTPIHTVNCSLVDATGNSKGFRLGAQNYTSLVGNTLIHIILDTSMRIIVLVLDDRMQAR